MQMKFKVKKYLKLKEMIIIILSRIMVAPKTVNLIDDSKITQLKFIKRLQIYGL